MTEQIETIELEPLHRERQGAPAPPWYAPASLLSWLALNRWYLLVVIMPTAIGALYFGLLAADRYEAEARFVVRSPSSAATSQLTSLVQGTGIVRSSDDAFIVHAYMQSRDMVRQLVAEDQLVERLQRPEVDILWLYPGLLRRHSSERLWRHFQSFISVDYNSTTGISTLRVQAFRPEDAKVIAEALLRNGEKLVNGISDRSLREAIQNAAAEVEASRARARASLERITEFRRRHAMIDPGRTSAAALETITRLALEIAKVNAELGELRLTAADSPQAKALVQRVAAYEAQVDKERSQLAGADTSLAPLIAEYERLVLEREFAERTFASAQLAHDIARLESERQRLFIERVSSPVAADYAKYPYRLIGVIAVFLVSFMLFSVLRQLLADNRSHDAR